MFREDVRVQPASELLPIRRRELLLLRRRRHASSLGGPSKRRRLLLIVAAVTAASYTMPVAGTAAADQLGTITEFSTNITPGGQPYRITAGPDRNLWFTEVVGSRIGRITPTGDVTEFSANITAGSSPAGIVAGPDENLWFTEAEGNRIGRITPTGTVTEFSGLTPASTPESITVGPEGNLWFTEVESQKIGRITPTGTVTEFPVGGAGFPAEIVLGSDHNLWFTTGIGVDRMTPSGTVTEFTTMISPGSSGTSGIAAGPDGNIWFVENPASRIGRITTSGAVTEFSTGITPNSFPAEITAGPDGNLWFTEDHGNRIARITPAGTVTEYSDGMTANSRPLGITAGPDGNVWFAELEGNRIGRITATGSVPPPAVSGLSSAVGSLTGGTSVTISGNNLSGAEAVRFGSTPAKSFKVESDSSITAIAPAGNGSVHVTVTTAAGTSAAGAADEFTYISLAPEFGRCLEVTPGSGGYADAGCTNRGGEKNYEWYPAFTGPRHMLRTRFTLASASSLTAKTVGGVSVECSTASGSGTYSDNMTETNVVNRYEGCRSSGVSCTSTGAPVGTIVTNPLEAALGVLSRSPSNPYEDRVGLDLFPRGHTGTIAEFACGPVNVAVGGSVIVPVTTNQMAPTQTLNFNAAFGRQEWEKLEGEPKDVLAVSHGGGTPEQGGLSLRLNQSSEEAIEISAAGHPVLPTALPGVSNVSPSFGSTAGGDAVTISGSGFTSAAAVRFGAAPAKSFEVKSDTEIRAIAPAGGGTVDVTVASAAGTSANTSADQFSYVDLAPEYGRCVEVSAGRGGYGDAGCTTRGGAQNYEWDPAFGGSAPLARTHFTIGATTAFRAETVAGETVRCEQASGSGEYSGNRAVANLTITAEGCALPGPNYKCNSAGAREGTIVSKLLAGTLGVIARSPVSPYEDKIGVLLSPQGGTGVVAEFSCGPVSNVITGSVIGPLGTGEMTASAALSLTATAGHQQPEEFEGGPKSVLKVKTGSRPAVQGGLTFHATQTSEEALEVSAISHPALVESKGSTPGTVEVTSAPGTAVRSVTTSQIPPSEPLPPGATAAVGGVSYEVAGLPSGGSTTVTLQLPAGSRPTSVYKLIEGKYVAMPSAVISGDTVTLTLVDGGVGDQDGTANGVIVDPVVPVRQPPSVTGVKPSKGPASGGATVTIGGTDFPGATAVKFGSMPADSFTVQTIKGVTSIVASSPAGTAGTVDVTVTTPLGTSAVVERDRFKFVPTISSVTPNSGSTAGGTSVTVTGSGFTVGSSGTLFRFGTAKASSVSCASSTECTVASPAHTAGTVDVKATVNKLSSGKTAADQFSYS